MKFRVWSNEEKKMHYGGDLIMNNDDNWCLGEVTPRLYNLEFDPWVQKKEGIIMWGSGIQDINGKEIYEGDIIEFHSDLTYFKKYNVVINKGVVLFYRGAFLVRPLINGSNSDLSPIHIEYYLYNLEKLKVVGNTYECVTEMAPRDGLEPPT